MLNEIYHVPGSGKIVMQIIIENFVFCLIRGISPIQQVQCSNNINKCYFLIIALITHGQAWYASFYYHSWCIFALSCLKNLSFFRF